MEKLFKKHIGKNIQRARKYFGVKQGTLAIDLGISQQLVSKIEQQKEIKDDLLIEIAKILGVSPNVIKDFDQEGTIYSVSSNKFNDDVNIGRKIERIRRLQGISQTELGNVLGITKQAVSKMERVNKMKNEKVKQVANALGIAEDSLKNFNQEGAIGSMQKLKTFSIEAYDIENLDIIQLEKTIKYLKKFLQKKKEKLKKERSKNMK